MRAFLFATPFYLLGAAVIAVGAIRPELFDQFLGITIPYSESILLGLVFIEFGAILALLARNKS